MLVIVNDVSHSHGVDRLPSVIHCYYTATQRQTVSKFCTHDDHVQRLLVRIWIKRVKGQDRVTRKWVGLGCAVWVPACVFSGICCLLVTSFHRRL